MKIIGILLCILLLGTGISIAEVNMQVKTTENKDFSHNIFAESGTATNCKYCKYSHAALINIYNEGFYPFYYVNLVYDNSKTYTRINKEYNVKGFPTVFFDGGYKVNLGAADVESAQAEYESSIIECGNRAVPGLDLSLDVTWQEDTKISIDVSIKNNEAEEYNGRLRVYITEKISSLWLDTWNNPYTFAFLDYAINEDININSGGEYQKSVIWNGDDGDYGFVTTDNVMIFAAVFNSEKHQGYADPPNGYPFDAYYVDEVVAESPPVGSTPPTKPTISGPNSGTPSNEYTYEAITTDNDGDQLHYWFEWGDDTNSGWLGPYDSGDTANTSHIWSNRGVYKVKVKAKDPYNVGSEWSDILLVTMPRSKISGNNLFLNLLERFLNVFPILQQLLNR